MIRGTKIILLALALAPTGAWAQSGAPAATPPAQAAKPAAPTSPDALPSVVFVPAVKSVVPTAEERRFIEADAAFRNGSYDEAYLKLLPLAHRGEARAEYLLGVMADNGLGPVPLDPTEAARWYKRAAEKNNADAQFALANDYATARGVPVDAKQAVTWLQRAAKNNHTGAMLSLAGLLDTGLGGIEQKTDEAANWIKQAADAGSVRALYLYAQRLEQGRGVPKDEKLAAIWYKRAAERGYPAAELWLGRRVGDGLNASQDENIAAYTWLTLALQRGQGQVQTDAAQARRALQVNMLPADIAEATTRARAWKRAPQVAGLAPDPEFDLPPVKPGANGGGQNAAGTAGAGGRGG